MAKKPTSTTGAGMMSSNSAETDGDEHRSTPLAPVSGVATSVENGDASEAIDAVVSGPVTVVCTSVASANVAVMCSNRSMQGAAENPTIIQAETCAGVDSKKPPHKKDKGKKHTSLLPSFLRRKKTTSMPSFQGAEETIEEDTASAGSASETPPLSLTSPSGNVLDHIQRQSGRAALSPRIQSLSGYGRRLSMGASADPPRMPALASNLLQLVPPPAIHADIRSMRQVEPNVNNLDVDDTAVIGRSVRDTHISTDSARLNLIRYPRLQFNWSNRSLSRSSSSSSSSGADGGDIIAVDANHHPVPVGGSLINCGDRHSMSSELGSFSLGSVAGYQAQTVHTQVDYMHCLVPDLLQLTNCAFYWGVMDRYEAERLLENRPEGTFLVRDSAQDEYLFSVSFRRYGRSLHARVEQLNHRFSFDSHDTGVFSTSGVCKLIEHYKDPVCCMFFEPMLTLPLTRTFVFSLQHLCRAIVCSAVTYDSISQLPLPKSLHDYLKYYHYKQKICVRRLEAQ